MVSSRFEFKEGFEDLLLGFAVVLLEFWAEKIEKTLEKTLLGATDRAFCENLEKCDICECFEICDMRLEDVKDWRREVDKVIVGAIKLSLFASSDG